MHLKPVSSSLRWRDQAIAVRFLLAFSKVKLQLMSGVRTYQTDWMIDGDTLQKGFRYNDMIAVGSVHHSLILITKSNLKLKKKYFL